MLSLALKVRKGSGLGRRAPRDRSHAVARAWAEEVRQRVFVEGKVQGTPSYADHGPVKVPAGYAPGGQPLPNGAVYFASSGALRLRGGYAATSKGMRRGLVVRRHGKRAVVEFTGSSLGANPVWVDGQATGQHVPNADKAGTVLEAHSINVLELAPSDLDAIRLAAVEWARDQLGRALNGLVRWRSKRLPRGRFGQRLMRER